jgi:hypothetical protein
MNRRGQVFLLLTILVITFISGIALVLVDVQRSRYSDPAPYTSNFVQTWELSILTIENIMIQTIAHSSDGILTTDIERIAFINDQLDRFIDYLTLRGFTSAIVLDEDTFDYIEDTDPSDQLYELSDLEFSVKLSTGRMVLSQIITMDLGFYASVDASDVNFYKLMNNEFFPLTDMSFTGVMSFSGGSNGIFTASAPGVFSALHMTGVLFSDMTV